MSGEERNAPESALLAGKYRLLRPLGEGAFGTVFLAEDVHLDAPVAIKNLSRHAGRDAAMQARFIQEARCLSRLGHPHIVRIYSLECAEGSWHLVMEYLPGGSLADVLRERGRLDTGEALRIARDVLDGLACAHAHGVVHRDVKPENILFDAGDVAKLTDFGVAHIPEGMGGSRLTREGIQPGTVLYMAPEQVAGEPVDGRADLYAVGATLYHALAGRICLELDTCRSLPAACIQILERRPDPLASLVPDLPAEVDGFVGRLLSKRPADRFASAEEALEALVPLLPTEIAPRRPDLTRGAPLPAPDREIRERYREVLELFLADGVLVSSERRVLEEKAAAWGIDPDTAAGIEREVLEDSGLGYDQRDVLRLEEMVRLFLADGILQDEERALLDRKARTFGVSDSVVENIIRIVRASGA